MQGLFFCFACKIKIQDFTLQCELRVARGDLSFFQQTTIILRMFFLLRRLAA